MAIPSFTDFQQRASQLQPNIKVEQLHALHIIGQLDLEPIVFKLTQPEDDEPGCMGLQEADQQILHYRGFLVLNVLLPSATLVPTRKVDKVWHCHILDTEKYREDTAIFVALYGQPLEHFPYLGLRGPADKEALQEAFQQTLGYYRQLGIELTGTASSGCSSLCSGHCNTRIQGERPRPQRVG